MYEELLTRIHKYADEYADFAGERHKIVDEAADAIEGLSHAVDQMTEWRKNQWIPVTERLPEKSGLYLTWIHWSCDEFPTYAVENYDADEERFGDWTDQYDVDEYEIVFKYRDFVPLDNVLAWMPLPSPPVEE